MSIPSSTSSLTDFRAREEQLRRLDAQLNDRKNEVVRRAEELVQQQAERLQRMDANTSGGIVSPRSMISPRTGTQTTPSYEHHSFTSHDQGFLDETTGYRGRVENLSGPSALSRPLSGAYQQPSATTAARTYSRPVSAATQEGRRRSSGIPTTMTTGANAQRAASAHRITPSSLASSSAAYSSSISNTTVPASASRPLSRARQSAAPTAPVDSYTRQESYDEQQPEQPDDGGYIDDATGAQEEVAGSPDDAGLEGLELPAGAMGSAATIRFQKARIQALSSSITSLTSTLASIEKERADLKLLVKNGNDSREKLLRAKEALEKANAAQTKTITELEGKLAHAEGEASGLRRDQSQGEKRKKELETEAKGKDAKLNRCLAELERVKEQLSRAKAGGGGGSGAGSEEVQKELTALRLGNKKLLQQRQDLLSGFKKQQKLIEILKKQKLHMELAKMLNFTEEEFAKSLEMGEI